MTNRTTCRACAVEAEMGTDEVPHPVDRRVHTCDAQVNEVYLKTLCHNIVVLNSAVFELGIEPQFAEEIGRVA